MIRPVRPIGPDDLCLRSKCPNNKPNEQDSPDAERETAKIDLPDKVTEPDGKEHREDRLRADDFAREVYHDSISEN